MPLLAALAAAVLGLAPALASGAADDAAVIGLRPAAEVRVALRDVVPQLAACGVRGDGALVVDVEMLAAGFVDRVTVLHDDGPLDTACAVSALRALRLRDRGREPTSHAVVALRAGAVPSRSPKEVAAALEPARDDVAHCLERARHDVVDGGGTVLARFMVKPDGSVAGVDATAGTLRSDPARACIAGALARIRFAPAPAAARVVFPLFVDKPAPPPDPRRRSPWSAPTLFDCLGCGALGRP